MRDRLAVPLRRPAVTLGVDLGGTGIRYARVTADGGSSADPWWRP
jgi:hypothetical protein